MGVGRLEREMSDGQAGECAGTWGGVRGAGLGGSGERGRADVGTLAEPLD